MSNKDVHPIEGQAYHMLIEPRRLVLLAPLAAAALSEPAVADGQAAQASQSRGGARDQWCLNQELQNPSTTNASIASTRSIDGLKITNFPKRPPWAEFEMACGSGVQRPRLGLSLRPPPRTPRRRAASPTPALREGCSIEGGPGCFSFSPPKSMPGSRNRLGLDGFLWWVCWVDPIRGPFRGVRCATHEAVQPPPQDRVNFGFSTCIIPSSQSHTTSAAG